VIDIVVPKWGLTMEEAEVVVWHKAVGDQVNEGEPVCDLETDKLTNEVEAPATGTIVEILAGPGVIVEPGAVLARLAPAADS
jgi:pyruvate/2-oxoglutarate dehydrogenase complex dihydrolipoamide acyltransferase (E2) component